MFEHNTLDRIRARVEKTTGIALPYAICAKKGEGLAVTLEDGRAAIAAQDENALARGLFLLARCVKEGKDALEIRQQRHFASCGVMVDVSRGAVLTVPAVKRYIDQMACLGMNVLMLYTEDTYEVPEYPYMGYLRGRYSQSDLREIDAYAREMGVELVPCIQTLGHMRHFLNWTANAELRDQADILLIDSEKTYALIEAQIRAMRNCTTSGRINVGMDEAHGVGLGQYLLKYGQTDRFELLLRHLKRVVALCEKYGFRPMMWSDMFFRLGSKTNAYYDMEADIPQSVIDAIPEVDLCYWDYYHDDAKLHDHMLSEHARMGRTAFAGGNWVWSGFLPHIKQTERTMIPALSACARHKVDTVLATMWGDDGAETNVFLGSSLLPLFSEACWQGEDCPKEEVVRCGEALTGLPRRMIDAMGEFYPNGEDVRPGKQFIWCDPLYPLVYMPGDTPDAAIARGAQAMETLREMEDNLECRYAAQCFDVMIEKAKLVRDMRAKYLAGDRAWLRETAHVDIPRMLQKYDKLMALHQQMWDRDMKRNGWEVICMRYGAAQMRLKDVADEIKRYLCGDLATIAELEEEPLDTGHGWMRYQDVVTPAAAMGAGF